MPRNRPVHGRPSCDPQAAPNKYEEDRDHRRNRPVGSAEAALRREKRRDMMDIRSAELITVPLEKARCVVSNIKGMVEDLQAIEKMRADRQILHGIVNVEYDLDDMTGAEKQTLRLEFAKIYEDLPSNIFLEELFAMAVVRRDKLTRLIQEGLEEVENTFGVKIVDDWER